MRARYGLLVPAALAFAATGSVQAPDPLAAAIQGLTGLPEYRHSFWGIRVAEMDSGRVLFDLNGEKLFRPASVTKLFTVAAALQALGPEYRFRTPVYRSGPIIADGTLEGDLILAASGDPTMSGRNGASGRMSFRNHDHTYAGFLDDAALTEEDPLTGLRQLARQVAESGVRRVRGEVVVDDRLFAASPGTGSGPSRISPIMINDNVIDFTVTPGAPGAAAKVKWRPHCRAIEVDARVKTGEPFSRGSVTITSPSAGRFVVRGEIAAGRPPLVRIAEAADPASFARSLFIEALEKAGIAVEASAMNPNPAARLPDRRDLPNLAKVAELTSPPFSEEARLILKVSHNLHAGALPLLLAAREGKRTLEEGLRIQGRLLRQLGAPVDAISLGSGAGGSPVDLVSPAATVELLRIMARRADAAVFEDALPVMGVDGTLAAAVGPDSPARGRVKAKTGTFNSANPLNGTVMLSSKSLAGYLTTLSGRRLAFAFFLNHVPPDASPFPMALRQGQAMARLCESIVTALE